MTMQRQLRTFLTGSLMHESFSIGVKALRDLACDGSRTSWHGPKQTRLRLLAACAMPLRHARCCHQQLIGQVGGSGVGLYVGSGRVCSDSVAVVQEICEPIFENVKPPFMNKLGFRKLNFGDAPIRIEAVRMNRERKEGVFLELDFRWAGDPDIQLFVDAIGGCVLDAHALPTRLGNVALFQQCGRNYTPAFVLKTCCAPCLSHVPFSWAAIGSTSTFIQQTANHVCRLCGVRDWRLGLVQPALPCRARSENHRGDHGGCTAGVKHRRSARRSRTCGLSALLVCTCGR